MNFPSLRSTDNLSSCVYGRICSILNNIQGSLRRNLIVAIRDPSYSQAYVLLLETFKKQRCTTHCSLCTADQRQTSPNITSYGPLYSNGTKISFLSFRVCALCHLRCTMEGLACGAGKYGTGHKGEHSLQQVTPGDQVRSRRSF